MTWRSPYGFVRPAASYVRPPYRCDDHGYYGHIPGPDCDDHPMSGCPVTNCGWGVSWAVLAKELGETYGRSRR